MKFINKLMLIVFLRVMTAPSVPAEAGGLALSIYAILVATGIAGYALLWEFTENLADLTALNEVIEGEVKQKTMDLLDWLSYNVHGEKIGS